MDRNSCILLGDEIIESEVLNNLTSIAIKTALKNGQINDAAFKIVKGRLENNKPISMKLMHTLLNACTTKESKEVKNQIDKLCLTLEQYVAYLVEILGYQNRSGANHNDLVFSDDLKFLIGNLYTKREDCKAGDDVHNLVENVKEVDFKDARIHMIQYLAESVYNVDICTYVDLVRWIYVNYRQNTVTQEQVTSSYKHWLDSVEQDYCKGKGFDTGDIPYLKKQRELWNSYLTDCQEFIEAEFQRFSVLLNVKIKCNADLIDKIGKDKFDAWFKMVSDEKLKRYEAFRRELLVII